MSSEHEWKAGDRVRALCDVGDYIRKGDVGTVAVVGNSNDLWCKWENPITQELDEYGWCIRSDEVTTADAAIASLSAPQPPVEAHCATCSCVPGMTPAVRFDATPAEKEGAVRDHLIRMGWTPPAEAQPVALDYVPVKRSDLLRWAEDFVRDNDPGDDTDVVTPFDDYLLRPFADEFSHDLRALAQQPAAGAVDEAMVERACKAAVAQCAPDEVWPDNYEEADDLRAMMKAALAAALAGQQGDKK